MKITYLFVALMAIILSGCEQEANVLYLTIVIAVLTLVMVIQNVGKVKNLIGRFFVWTRKIVGSLAHSYMQRFPKTQKVTKPPVKQNEVSNESKGSSRKPPTQGN